jgi:two-component sensor histidine kinase
VGPPAGFDPQNCTTLGMRLVSALCTQIAGNLAVDSTGPGARFSVAFR